MFLSVNEPGTSPWLMYLDKADSSIFTPISNASSIIFLAVRFLAMIVRKNAERISLFDLITETL